MINILLHKKGDSFFKYAANMVDTEELLVITPNPVQADIVRKRFEQENLQNTQVQTVTVAKFLKDELTQLVESELLENFKGKSELNLLLGALWKKMKPDESYEIFKRSFQLLTDFRSFTMSEDVLETVLENYDEDLAGAVLWYHRLLNEMEIIDEHKSYFLLSDRLRSGDLPPDYKINRSIVFWGFEFLTGSQVDLINSFAIRENIYIPFPEMAYAKSSDLDWIKWLARFDANVIKIDGESEEMVNQVINYHSFAKNYLSKTLSSIKNDERFKDKQFEYILGAKQFADEYLGELPFGNIKYKVGVDLFSEKLGTLKDYLFEGITKNGPIEFTKLISQIQEYSKEVMQEQDFRLLKAIAVFLDTLNQWTSLSDANEQIGIFDLKILFDSVALDMPRTSLTTGVSSAQTNTQSSEQTPSAVKYIKTIDYNNDSDTINLFCVTSSYGPIKGSVVQYSENVEKYLASIGPVRRSELEFLILKSKIQEKLLDKNTYLLIEDGILKHDIGWSSIVAEDLRESFALDLNIDQKKDYIFPEFSASGLEHQIKSISASRLQTYIDCPRKYYLNYVLKQRPQVEIPGELNLLQLGLLEHQIIEEYLKANRMFDIEVLNELILKIFNDFTADINFSEDKREEYLLELKGYCTRVIEELLIFNNTIGLALTFEKVLPSVGDIKIAGSIDCYGENTNTLMILDFKRGGGSIPSQVGLKEFSKIQLWFYLKRMLDTGKYQKDKKLIWGYINLSKLEESLVYCNDELLITQLNDLGTKMFSKVHHFDSILEDNLTEYCNFESGVVNSLIEEKLFEPKPKDKLVCTYCDLNKTCPRAAKQEVK